MRTSDLVLSRGCGRKCHVLIRVFEEFIDKGLSPWVFSFFVYLIFGSKFRHLSSIGKEERRSQDSMDKRRTRKAMPAHPTYSIEYLPHPLSTVTVAKLVVSKKPRCRKTTCTSSLGDVISVQSSLLWLYTLLKIAPLVGYQTRTQGAPSEKINKKSNHS